MGSARFAQNLLGVCNLATPAIGIQGLCNHHFRGLDHRQGVVTPLQLQRMNRIGGHHRGQHLVANAKPHLREQAVDANLLDESEQAVARAESGQGVVGIRRPRRAGLAGRLAMGGETINLRVGNAMVPAPVNVVRTRPSPIQRFMVE